MLQHATELTREALLCEFQARPEMAALHSAASLLERRLAGEPLQYVLGESWFYGRRFTVDRRVLIPRPETELLVETAMTLRGAMPRIDGTLFLADIGTGSGALAVTLAEGVDDCRVVGCDMSRDALAVAHVNRVRSSSGARISLLQCNLGAPCGRVFGGVLGNLPYIRTGDIPLLSREIRDHEPISALDGGPDGLHLIRRMVEEAPGLLLDGGWLLLEVGEGQAQEVMSMMAARPRWDALAAIPDLNGIPRVVQGRLTCSSGGKVTRQSA